MWKVSYHKRVITEDIPRLDTIIKKRIRIAIESKILVHPEIYSKPLNGTLKNFRSARVGDYRIVFEVLEEELFILIIKHRNAIYTDISKRL